MSDALLLVEELQVRFGGPGAPPVVRELSFSVAPGEVVALVGESGSGKSVTARSIMGLAGDGAQVSARRLFFQGLDLLGMDERRWRGVRGRRIGFVLQDALGSLDPLRTVGAEIEEALAVHGWRDRAARRAEMLRLLDQVGLPDPAGRAEQRSEQMSGGQRQRALIAAALAHDPSLVIADEPTTALDATVAARILDLFGDIRARGKGVLLISHDLDAVARVADRVVVMRDGEVMEQGDVASVLRHPRHAYTRKLLDAVPRGDRPARPASPQRPVGTSAPDAAPSRAGEARQEPLLEVVGLRKSFPGPDGGRRMALDDVSLRILPGRTLGLIGESGCGKSTLARIVLGLTAPDAGHVRFDGRAWNGAGADAVPERRRRPHRHAMGVVPQDPLASFDPRWSVEAVLRDALEAASVPSAARAPRIIRLLDAVRLPAGIAARRPIELSGGQRQRVAIARALAGEPRLMICDEPVSALDVSVQAQILELLESLQNDLGVALLFISHDLGVVRRISDWVVVMKEGRVVEEGTGTELWQHPQHPLTRALVQSTHRSAPVPG
ncbi:dipeptide ABC transporter ATP-binding protein [Rhizosaccharibacter radicis]|uniref:ABC transporter ATP-binding protein n=1 Tax=Rhizosaccharibacter radicis TaxID=2782605 RepID=A0ABT1W2M2_9PROT|nr:ABC transporter ATP-binding protein [Acetobacteraceae bacterium KSS12]